MSYEEKRKKNGHGVDLSISESRFRSHRYIVASLEAGGSSFLTSLRTFGVILPCSTYIHRASCQSVHRALHMAGWQLVNYFSPLEYGAETTYGSGQYDGSQSSPQDEYKCGQYCNSDERSIDWHKNMPLS